MPLLSVIVPFHDVERYVGECLESLRRQTLADLEVVLVDDGSGDGTRAIVERFCDLDPRFRLITQENQGPGPARNNGLSRATGEFLAFADADDVVDLDGYRTLVASLTRTGSDLAAGSAGRFNNLGVSSSFAHQIAIVGNSERTHISRQPELVLDRMLWNKVFRRSFWDRHGFTFPALLMGEDFPVTIGAHVAAEAVDVIDDVLYHWRERDGGEPSITQRSAELGNLDDRLASAEQVLGVVEAGAPDSLALLRRHLLEIDLTAVVAALTVHPVADHGAILDRAVRLVARIGADAAEELAPFHRVQLALVQGRDADALVDLHRWSHRYGRQAGVVRHGRLRRRYLMALPSLGSRAVPESAFALPDGPAVSVCVEDAAWDGGVLEVRGLVDVPIALGDRSTLTGWLETKNGRRVPVALERHQRRRPFVGTDLAGFSARIDPGVLADADGGPNGFWALKVRIESKDVSGEYAATEASFQRARFVQARTFPGRPALVVQPFRSGQGFGLQVREPRVVLAGCVVDGERLVLSGTSTEPGPAVLVLAGRHGVDHRVPVETTSGGFRVELPGDLLATNPDYLTPAATQSLYDAHLEVGGDRRPVTLAPGFSSTELRAGHRAVRATRGFNGNLQVVEERIAPVVRAISWAGPTTLRVDGTWAGDQELPAEVVLQHFEHPADGVEARVALTSSGPAYRFEVDVAELVRLQRQDRDPYDGPDPAPWHLVLPFADHVAPQVCDRDALGDYPEARDVDGARVAVVVGRGDLVRVRIGD